MTSAPMLALTWMIVPIEVRDEEELAVPVPMAIAVIIAIVDVAAKAALDVCTQEPPVSLPVSEGHRLRIVGTPSGPVFDDVFGILG